jgi:hypothetical protein
MSFAVQMLIELLMSDNDTANTYRESLLAYDKATNDKIGQDIVIKLGLFDSLKKNTDKELQNQKGLTSLQSKIQEQQKNIKTKKRTIKGRQANQSLQSESPKNSMTESVSAVQAVQSQPHSQAQAQAQTQENTNAAIETVTKPPLQIQPNMPMPTQSTTQPPITAPIEVLPTPIQQITQSQCESQNYVTPVVPQRLSAPTVQEQEQEQKQKQEQEQEQSIDIVSAQTNSLPANAVAPLTPTPKPKPKIDISMMKKSINSLAVQ